MNAYSPRASSQLHKRVLITLWSARRGVQTLFYFIRRKMASKVENEAASQVLVMESQFARSLEENRKRLKEEINGGEDA